MLSPSVYFMLIAPGVMPVNVYICEHGPSLDGLWFSFQFQFDFCNTKYNTLSSPKKTVPKKPEFTTP